MKVEDSEQPDILWINGDRIPAGAWPFLLTSRASLMEIKQTILRDEVDLTEDHNGVTITGKLEVYRQMIVRRVLDLAQAMAVSWNVGQAIGALACARSLLETLATFHSLLKQSKAAAGESDWDQIDFLVDAYTFSTSKGPGKKKPSGGRPPRIGELVVGFIKETQPGAEQFWEQICDMAHPNGQSTFRHFLFADTSSVLSRPRSESEPGIFIAIYNCAYSICWFLEAMSEFDILLEHIRSGEAPGEDHPLIAERMRIDAIVAEVLTTSPRGRAGPTPTKRRPPTRQN